MAKILLITNSSGEPGQVHNLVRFMEQINQTSEHQYGYCMVQDLVFSNVGGTISVRLAGKELHEIYDVIHLRNHNNFNDYAAALKLYARQYEVTLINADDVMSQVYGKVSQGFLFTIHGIPTPDLLSSPRNSVLVQAVTESSFGYPLIVKHNDGIKGLHNYLVKSADELKDVLSQDLQHFVAQPFVANGGELRILTFGSALPPVVFRKYATTESHLNNTSRGGGAEQMDPASVSPEIMQAALAAAKITKRDVGGVDVLLANDGSYCILEVNSSPAIASGVFSETKVAHYSQYMHHLLEQKTLQKEERP